MPEAGSNPGVSSEVLASLGSPAKLQTPFGEMEFFDGVPSPSPTYSNWIVIRALDGLDALMTTRIYPLAAAGDPPETGFVDFAGSSFNGIHDSDSQTSDWAPAWSPNATRIAFTGHPNVNGTVGPAGLWVANTTGAPNPTAFTADGTSPTWSPGGTRIAFERAGSIWTMDADGSNQVSLTTGGQPSWAAKK